MIAVCISRPSGQLLWKLPFLYTAANGTLTQNPDTEKTGYYKNPRTAALFKKRKDNVHDNRY